MTASTKKQNKPAPNGPVFSSRREAIRATREPGEIPDPTPVELAISHTPPPNLREEMMQFIRSQISNAARSQELETFEEADDFDMPDDDMPELFNTAYTVMSDEPGALLLEPESDVQTSDSDTTSPPAEPVLDASASAEQAAPPPPNPEGVDESDLKR